MFNSFSHKKNINNKNNGKILSDADWMKLMYKDTDKLKEEIIDDNLLTMIERFLDDAFNYDTMANINPLLKVIEKDENKKRELRAFICNNLLLDKSERYESLLNKMESLVDYTKEPEQIETKEEIISYDDLISLIADYVGEDYNMDTMRKMDPYLEKIMDNDEYRTALAHFMKNNNYSADNKCELLFNKMQEIVMESKTEIKESKSVESENIEKVDIRNIILEFLNEDEKTSLSTIQMINPSLEKIIGNKTKEQKLLTFIKNNTGLTNNKRGVLINAVANIAASNDNTKKVDEHVDERIEMIEYARDKFYNDLSSKKKNMDMINAIKELDFNSYTPSDLKNRTTADIMTKSNDGKGNIQNVYSKYVTMKERINELTNEKRILEERISYMESLFPSYSEKEEISKIRNQINSVKNELTILELKTSVIEKKDIPERAKKSYEDLYTNLLQSEKEKRAFFNDKRYAILSDEEKEECFKSGSYKDEEIMRVYVDYKKETMKKGRHI